MLSPTVSVLIPVYNAGDFLEKCLDSIVGQTYRNLQVVLVDDGSTDDSEAICRRYAENDSRIKVYSKPNSGVAATRNALLSKISGEYVLFVDADDWIEPDMIEYLISVAHRDNAEIVCCSNVINDGVPSKDFTESVWNQRQAIEKFLVHRDMNGSLWNKLIKADLLRGIVLPVDISYGEDAFICWQALQKVKCVAVSTRQLYHYRMNEGSISHQSFGPKKMSGHKVWRRFYDDTVADWPEFEPIVRASFAISDMWLLYYAAMSRYPYDDNIRRYQHHIRRNMPDILRATHIKVNKKIFALGMALSYGLGGFMIRTFQ